MSMTTRSSRTCRHSEERREPNKGSRLIPRTRNLVMLPASLGPSQSSAQQIHTIIIEDDDDDAQSSSTRSSAEARSYGRASRQGFSHVQDIGLSDERLDLRLGPSDFMPPPSLRLRLNTARRSEFRPDCGVPLTIDLTSPTRSNEDCIIITEKKAPQVSKRKRVPSVPGGAKEQAGQEPVKEPKLTCPICMDVMKEETSTVCGHLFCKECISGAIATQKKCPTCRHKLTIRCTHRIYLTASLRNS